VSDNGGFGWVFMLFFLFFIFFNLGVGVVLGGGGVVVTTFGKSLRKATSNVLP
jgi:hypothetical protein